MEETPYNPNRAAELEKSRASQKNSPNTASRSPQGVNQGVAATQGIQGARQGVKNMKNLAQAATPVGLAKLGKQIELVDFLKYGPAFAVAFLKDLLDWVGIGSLPAIGTVITFCVSITIGFIFLMAGASGKRTVAKSTMRWLLTLVAGTGVEAFLFGLNFFPIETFTVLIAYIFVLQERRGEKKEDNILSNQDESETMNTTDYAGQQKGWKEMQLAYQWQGESGEVPNAQVTDLREPGDKKEAENSQNIAMFENMTRMRDFGKKNDGQLTEKAPANENDQLDAFKRAKEKVLSLQTKEGNKPAGYWDLYAHITEGFGENLKWRDVSEVNVDHINSALEAINKHSDIPKANKLDGAKEGAEPEHGSLEYYIRKSKIKDRNEALQELIEYSGANSEEDLRKKLKEKDEQGDNIINIFTPEYLDTEKKPNLRLLKKIHEGGKALGYNFVNTPGYEYAIDDIIGRFRDEGKIDQAIEVERLFQEERSHWEREKEKSEFREIDQKLMNMDESELEQYVEKQRNLPPDGIVYLYHGLNNGGYEKVQTVLNSHSQGIEQHSGPTFSFVPVGQFWKKGDLGFRYAIRRDQVEFPGENNPNAIVKIEDNGKTGIICTKSGSLPLSRFEADIMRSPGTFPDFDSENKIKEKLRYFSEIRSTRKRV